MQWSSSAQNRARGIKARCTSTQAEYNNNTGTQAGSHCSFSGRTHQRKTAADMHATKNGICWRLFLISWLFLESSCQELGAQTQFICTSVPKDMDICAATLQNSVPGEDLKTTVMQLRETVLQQKETIMNQKETIRELTSKLARCESQSGSSEPGGRRKEAGTKNTMGDVSRGPADTLAQLSQTLQSLKLRLENLEQFSRSNNSVQANSLKDLLQSKIDDLEKQVLSRVNSIDEGKPGLRNETEQRGRVESTLTSLHQRITDLEKGQRESRPLDKFQLTFPLRTNYMYAKVKKSLPEMYALTVCMWLKSNASPGVGTPFSYAVPGQANELVLIEWGNNPMEILINDKVAKLPFLINDGKWHHICVTWTTRDGVWEAFQDGVRRGSGENLAPYHPIKPQGLLILGQEQDTLGGGFDATQAFVGDLANFHIWDRKLSVGEIYNLATCSSKAQVGNVFAWMETSLDIYGGASKWTFEACRQLN
ncbi:neuronal pentraxin 1 like [Labrus mixtus]|uniref:neuronal pentraxin 1 like n=1 Tax=Labrus mixtus TaxID=508554 RepID=UPI0029C08E6D|nr:neuronal pentraxin 1 like [Labrus mixtus]